MYEGESVLMVLMVVLTVMCGIWIGSGGVSVLIFGGGSFGAPRRGPSHRDAAGCLFPLTAANLA